MRAPQVLNAVTVGLFLLHTLGLLLRDPASINVLDGILGVITEILAVAMCARAVLRTRFAQAEVLLGTAAVIVYTLGDAYYLLALNGQEALPDVSAADVAYFAFYPLMLGALVMMMRRLKGLAWPMLLDSVVGALASAALMSLILTPVLAVASARTRTEVVVAVLYPLLDLLLITAAGALLASRGIDLGPRWPLLVTGLILFSAADLAFAFGMEEYAVGSVIDAGWVAGLVAIAIWVDGMARTDGALRIHAQDRPSFLAPVLSTASSLGVLLIGCQVQIPFLAQILAGSTLALAAIPLVFRNRMLAALATTDELTGLSNRRALLTRVPPRLGEGRTGALFLLDLDRFKDVNDAMGHDVGDALLIQVGRRFAGQLHPDDLLARLGGDEFAVFLDGATEQEAVAAARRLGTGLVAPIDLGTASLQVNASIGIVMTPMCGTDLDILMRKADVAMFRAKSERSGFRLYSPADDDGGTLNLRTLQELRTALVEQQFELHYQPKVHLRSEGALPHRGSTRVTSAEALLRWNHPARGQLLPASFLPLAEEAGLMPDITALVLERAIGRVATWRVEGREISVAVNLSSSVITADLPRQVRSLLVGHGIPAAQLILEITEDTLMADPVSTARILGQLRGMGVEISIDDFGTGYSSLAYLRDLPVDELKLDRSFITAMRESSRARDLVSSIVDLAHSLELRVVAEGVDNQKTVEELRGMGCDIAQGFHFARPLPAAEVIPWIASRSTDGPIPTACSTPEIPDAPQALAR